MKDFLKNITIFLFFFLSLFAFFAEIIFFKKNYLSDRFSFSHVLNRIYKSELFIDSDTLFLGDSVADQIFPFNNKNNSYAINGSVLMSGQYILLNNILKKNKPKHIYLIFHPTTFSNGFHDKRVFNSFVKPFFSYKYVKYFDQVIFESLNKKPYTYLYFFSFMKMLPLNDIVVERERNEYDEVFSNVNYVYFNKIIDLLIANQISFTIKPVPVREDLKTKVLYKFNSVSNRNSNIDSIIQTYVNDIHFVSNEYFKDDLHFEKSILQENKSKFQEWVLN